MVKFHQTFYDELRQNARSFNRCVALKIILKIGYLFDIVCHKFVGEIGLLVHQPTARSKMIHNFALLVTQQGVKF